MKQCLRGVTRVLLAVVFVAASFAPSVTAQSSSVGVTPAFPSEDNPRTSAIFIHTIKPGESASDGIMVVNNTKETRTVNLGVVDSSASVDGSFSCKQNTEKQTKVGTWIQLEKKSVELAAGTNEVVKFSINVPKGTGPGEHGGCITAQDTKSYGAKKGAGVLLGFRSAVRVAITVPGKIVKKLSIIRVETKRLPDGNYSVSPVAKNSGNVSLDVQTRAQLVSKFGQQTPIKDDAKYPIMPGATMGWPYVFERPFWGGFYKARVSISYNADPADGLGVHVDETKKVRAESSYFFMIPAPKAVVIYAVALLSPLVLLVWRLRKRRMSARIGKNWQTYIVRSGDTLVSLAAERGIRWRKLAKMNHIRAPFAITKGQEILVPSTVVDKNWAKAVSQMHQDTTEDLQEAVGHYETDDDFVEYPNQEQPKKRSSAQKIIYAPRPETLPRKKKPTKSGGYNWANPGSAWAPRVVSEDELERMIQQKAAQKKTQEPQEDQLKKGQRTG